MASVVRRGAALRTAVRHRRQARWAGVVGTSIGAATFAAIAAREADGLAIAGLCAVFIAFLTHAVTFIPTLERGALRHDVTRPPLTRAQAKRWASFILLIGAVVVAAALIAGAMFDVWLIAVGVAAPIALLFSLFAFFAVRAAKRENPR